nr:MAG TPA: hypothetical protein [Caudoviricetes sp.]
MYVSLQCNQITLLNNVAKIRAFFKCCKDYSGIFLLYNRKIERRRERDGNPRPQAG